MTRRLVHVLTVADSLVFIDEVVARGRLQNVTLARKVPVLLVYWTAWVDSSGALNFRPDIYGRDAKWSKALDEPFRFRSEPVGS